MKLIVFSDSHGKYVNMQKALDMHKNADILVHCGDGVSDLSSLDIPENMKIYKVNGNFEDFSGGQCGNRILFEAEGKRILVCHGHRALGFGNEYDIYTPLLRAAIGQEADIILHGHTHRKIELYYPQDELPEEYDRGIYIFNPGSISRPRDGGFCSYGIIEIRGKDVLFSHGEVK